LAAVYAVIDKRGREPANISREKLVQAVGKDSVADQVEKILEVSSFSDFEKAYGGNDELAPHVNRLKEYFSFIEALGFSDWVVLDMSVVRGLAYYTGIVFELFDTAGEFRAICGGGRYDTLLKTLGGIDLPALGFGMGDVVLGELLRARSLIPGAPSQTDYWVAGDDESMLPDVTLVAYQIRNRDRGGEYALKPQQLSRQLKAASSAGARN